jgi:hypothetical protein
VSVASVAQSPASAVSRSLELVAASPTATATLKYALMWLAEMRLSRPRNCDCSVSSGTAASSVVSSLATSSSPCAASRSRTVFLYCNEESLESGVTPGSASAVGHSPN